MGDREDGKRRRLDGVIPEILKRAVEAGVSQAQHAPENLRTFIGDMKLPKEIVSYIFSQVDDTKTGLFRVVAGEMRDFLEHTNIAGEMQKLLTTVQFEVNTTIRFRPNAPRPEDGDVEEGKLGKPDVKTEVTMSRSQRRERRRRAERASRPGSSGGTGGAAGDGGGDDGSVADVSKKEDERGGGAGSDSGGGTKPGGDDT